MKSIWDGNGNTFLAFRSENRASKTALGSPRLTLLNFKEKSIVGSL